MMAETRAQSRISSVVSVHRALHACLYAKLSVSILHPAIYLFTVHIDCTVSVLDLYLFAWQLQERTACVHSGWCMCAPYQIATVVPKKTYRLGQNSFACPHPPRNLQQVNEEGNRNVFCQSYWCVSTWARCLCKILSGWECFPWGSLCI